MKLSVIIPVYNEKNTIKEIINRVLKAKIEPFTREIVVVDDNSRDGTDKILKGLKNIKVVFHQRNQGKGAAVRTGISIANGDYILIQDADMEYDPNDIPKLLKPVLEGKAEVVYGSRFTGEHRNMLFWHMVGNKFLSLVTNILFNTTLSDMEVCYKLFSKESLKGVNLKENRFGFDPEITVKVLKKGIKIYEVPISYAGREFSEGKKICWCDGFRIIWVLVKYRLFN